MSEKVIVSVEEGKIQGCKNTSMFSGMEYYSFLGVPYGQSTASTRFKDPIKVKPWKNILNGTIEKGGCSQFSFRKGRVYGTEDCLYNNIHTPQVSRNNDDALKAVILNIHPGGSFHGSPDPEYLGSPDFVMHNDIVYVCVSFRIHILGFLNLDLKECSGNQGLKDIILSLQWIQRNIANFGGDPNNITLLGSSSGAVLINDLMISPRAKGLFHKAVIMGLYKYCPSLIVREENVTIAYKMAQKMGYSGPLDKKKILSFLKKLNHHAIPLARSDRAFLENDQIPCYPFSAFTTTIDFGENPVLPSSDKKSNLESMERIPLMIGFCEKESILGFLPLYKKQQKENFFKSIRQNRWGWGNRLNTDQLEYVQKKIESYYSNGKSIESMGLDTKCDIQTDIALSDLYTSLIDVVATNLPSQVYVYKFAFRGDVPTLKDLFNFVFEEPLTGTYHGDDICYWSRMSNFVSKEQEVLNPETTEAVNKFTKLISTFAKTGNPNYEELNIQWRPTTVENPCYLNFDKDLQMVNGKLNGNRMEFWENLKKEIEENVATSV